MCCSLKYIKGTHSLPGASEAQVMSSGWDKSYRNALPLLEIKQVSNETSTRAVMFPNTYSGQILSLVLLVLKK